MQNEKILSFFCGRERGRMKKSITHTKREQEKGLFVFHLKPETGCEYNQRRL